MAKGRGKQAKILSEENEALVLVTLHESGRYRLRNRVMFLLSVKAGLRAKEIACLTWGMVTDASGGIGNAILLEDIASKGAGGRTVGMNGQLRDAIVELHAAFEAPPHPDSTVIRSERGGPMSAHSVVEWFGDFYRRVGFNGCTSHSGRRTFITRGARKCSQVGASLRDVQMLAGHASLATTERYIEGDSDAQRRLVDLI